MSSFWTPEGERPVSPAPSDSDIEEELTPEQVNERMEELQRQLADTPASMVIANHCFGLFELAALHLSLPAPQLGEAKLAIDALASITEGLAGRLGEGEPQLKEGLAQLRLAYVQISEAAAATGRATPTN